MQHAQYQLAAVTHDHEIVEVKEIKRCQTKERRQRGFVESVSIDQRVFSICRTHPHVHSDYQAAEEQHCFDEQQENRTGFKAR